MEAKHFQTEQFTGIPAGWHYNPSKQNQRHPLTALAVVGLLAALYLGSYQLHFISNV